MRKVKTSEEVGVKYMQAWEEWYYELQDARAEGLEEGRAEGERARLLLLIQKKLAKGKSLEVIADEVEESVELVEQLIAEIAEQEEE